MPLFRVRFRRDTTENWEKYNPILLEGEVGYEVTKTPNLILTKCGDGYIAADGKIYGTPWKDLPYCSGPMGPSPEYQWDGSILMFKQPDGSWGPGQDLVGPVPAHRWIGTALQFQTQTGAWGNLVDLQGVPGNSNLLPATPTKIGGVIIGSGLSVTEQGCVSVDPDQLPLATKDKPGVSQPDNKTTQVGPTGLLSVLAGNLLINSEQWITTSGTWKVPLTAYYRVLIIDSGGGGYAHTGQKYVSGGTSGRYDIQTIFLTAGTEVSVTIAAGAKAKIETSGNMTWGNGGARTTFAGLQTRFDTTLPGNNEYIDNRGAFVQSGGFGGKDGNHVPGFYGAGGGGYLWGSGTPTLKDGVNGAVCVMWHDPDKIPDPSVTTFSLPSNIVLFSDDDPELVNLYEPDTGQGSVWSVYDAETAMKKYGLISEKEWLAHTKEKQAQENIAWASDPATQNKRNELLRQACQLRLDETDKLTLPDFPITEEQRQAILAYRQALRELNHQPGAPWDGGGEQTPWPAEPPFLAAILKRGQPTIE